jgi:hypothetical protein
VRVRYASHGFNVSVMVDGSFIGHRGNEPKQTQFFIRGLAQGAHFLTLQPLCDHAPCLLALPTITQFTVRNVGVAIDDGPLMIRDAGSIGCVQHWKRGVDFGPFCCFTSRQHYQSGFYHRSMDASYFVGMVEGVPTNCTHAINTVEVASFISGLVDLHLVDALRLDSFLRDKLSLTEHRMRAAPSKSETRALNALALLTPEYFTPEDSNENAQEDTQLGHTVVVLIASLDDTLAYLPVAAAAWKHVVGVLPVVVLCAVAIDAAANAVQQVTRRLVTDELGRLSVRVETVRSAHWASCQIDGLRHAVSLVIPEAFVWHADARVLPRCRRCFCDRDFST